jgi:membrane-associated phospholipid phosphatase
MPYSPERRAPRDREGPLSKLEATAGATLALVLACGVVPCRAQALDTPKDPEPAKSFDTQGLFDTPREDRRTLSAFPRNLGRNFVGVFSGQNLFPFAVGVGATTLASAFDYRTEHALKGACSTCGTTGATAGGSALAGTVGALFVVGRFAPHGRFGAMTYDFAQAVIVTEAYTGLLKYTVQRERPDGSDSLSFPSGHTSAAFSLANVAAHHYGWKVGLPAYALATGIGLSRIEQDRHHLSDVVAGATLGFIVGRTVTRRDGEAATKKSFVSVGPATDPHGQGVGLELSASW